MELNLDELARPYWNWRRKSPPNPRLINTSDKKFTARRRMAELQRELNKLASEFEL